MNWGETLREWGGGGGEGGKGVLPYVSYKAMCRPIG